MGLMKNDFLLICLSTPEKEITIRIINKNRWVLFIRFKRKIFIMKLLYLLVENVMNTMLF